MMGESLLELLAEVSVTLAGFAGVVAAFSSRRDDRWTALDVLRFLNMLWSSLMALVLSIATLVLLHVGLMEETTWLVSSLLMIGLLLPLLVWSLRQLTRVSRLHPGEYSPWISGLVFAVMIGAIALQVLNAGDWWVDRGFGPYIAGLVALILLCIIMFERLLSAVLRRGHADRI
ncbi:MAG: hypothetical protein AB7I04_11950 [Pseudomonadales bacterium]